MGDGRGAASTWSESDSERRGFRRLVFRVRCEVPLRNDDAGVDENEEEDDGSELWKSENCGQSCAAIAAVWSLNL